MGKTQWLGKTTCNFCSEEILEKDPPVLIDGKTIFGPWAVMCEQCFAKYGTGLGTGRGQCYELSKEGSFLKTAG